MTGSTQKNTSFPKGSGPKETYEGVVEKIIYVNEINHYTVAKFEQEGPRKEPIVIVGNLVGINPGEHLRIEGKWVTSRKFGPQFEVARFESILPSTTRGIERYLGSGLIKGIGKSYAKRIVQRFGEATLDILESDPDRLCEVKGIGRKRLGMITEAWEEQRHIRDVMLFLQTHNVSVAFASRIIRHYGPEAMDVLQSNPFQVALDVHGIGFKSADKIAGYLGIPHDSPMRIQAGIVHVLNELVEAGNTYYPRDELVSLVAEKLVVEEEGVTCALEALESDERVVVEPVPEQGKCVFPKAIHVSEGGCCDILSYTLTSPKLHPEIDATREIALFEQRYRFTLAPLQKEAVAAALKGGVIVVTGGPGTGKTTIVRCIIKILDAKGMNIRLAAPTGRAAKRLSETTGRPASTIHRLLKFDPRAGRFLFNEYNQLKADIVIIDETSMVDVLLAYHLLKAIPSHATIVFVGDADQLPSVGPGNFLRDLIQSDKVPVVELREIFRQAQKSLIIVNAHKVNHGEMPYLRPAPGVKHPDFFFIEKNEPEDILTTIRTLVADRIPHSFKLHPVDDIQVITPMYRGVIGADNLNRELQNLLNPGEDVLFKDGRVFKSGDKVMQITNNYDKDVYNGDIGIIEQIDRENQIAVINFDGSRKFYEFRDLSEVVLAYAISVHKAQGSEYEAVVLPFHTQHYVLLQRNLFYTALTRAKKVACIVGTKRAIAIAVKNDKTRRRFSALGKWLQSGRSI